jgi:hypothetical protein
MCRYGQVMCGRSDFQADRPEKVRSHQALQDGFHTNGRRQLTSLAQELRSVRQELQGIKATPSPAPTSKPASMLDNTRSRNASNPPAASNRVNAIESQSLDEVHLSAHDVTFLIEEYVVDEATPRSIAKTRDQVLQILSSTVSTATGACRLSVTVQCESPAALDRAMYRLGERDQSTAQRLRIAGRARPQSSCADIRGPEP